MRPECATLGSRCMHAQSVARSTGRLGAMSTDPWQSPRLTHQPSTPASTRGAAHPRARRADRADVSSVLPSHRLAAARSTATLSYASPPRAEPRRPVPLHAAIAVRLAVAVAATSSLPVLSCPCLASPTLPIMLDHTARNKLQSIYASLNSSSQSGRQTALGRRLMSPCGWHRCSVSR